MAVGAIVFVQLSNSQPTPAPVSILEEVAYLQGAADAQGEPLSLHTATARFPLQALKGEQPGLDLHQRLRPIHDLFSIGLLLFAFEVESFASKALYFYVKPACSSAPIYILFRQLLI